MVSKTSTSLEEDIEARVQAFEGEGMQKLQSFFFTALTPFPITLSNAHRPRSIEATKDCSGQMKETIELLRK